MYLITLSAEKVGVGWGTCGWSGRRGGSGLVYIMRKDSLFTKNLKNKETKHKE